MSYGHCWSEQYVFCCVVLRTALLCIVCILYVLCCVALLCCVVETLGWSSLVSILHAAWLPGNRYLVAVGDQVYGLDAPVVFP